jgi:hypothetical protein
MPVPTNRAPQARALTRTAGTWAAEPIAKESDTAYAAPCGERGQPERQDRARVEPVRRGERDDRDQQQVVRPGRGACGGPAQQLEPGVRNPSGPAGKLAMFGKTAGRSSAETPNQRASVEPYCSTEVVGIQRPRSYCETSSAPPTISSGPGAFTHMTLPTTERV